jgi:hypothetical protein
MLLFGREIKIVMLGVCLLVNQSYSAPNKPKPIESAVPAIKCMKQSAPLNVMNEQVLTWKKSSPNQYKDRALVEGVITNPGGDQNDHAHFFIQIGKTANDNLEVVYNKAFGALPALKTGSKIQACGDYITSNAPAAGYQASPAGAIIHWVHFNPKNQGHEHGYLLIDGKIYGNKYGDQGEIKAVAPKVIPSPRKPNGDFIYTLVPFLTSFEMDHEFLVEEALNSY